jgi:hypothetical protein
MKFFSSNPRLLRSWGAAALVVVALGSSVPAQAQELAPEHLELARKYVELTDNSSIYEVTLVRTAVETMRTLLSQNPEMSDPVDVAVKAVLDTYKERKGELLDQFARVYALRFSIEELQDIVAFYESPAGMKLVQVNATATQDLQAIQDVFEVNLRTEFFAKVRAELREAGIDL